MEEPTEIHTADADFFMAALWDAARPAGIEVPGYEIIEEISRGGMGAVYHARQLRPEREVALKVLLPQFTEETEMLARFQLEARAMAGLDHPGILPVYEVGEADGMPFFSMKLADGGSLADRLKQGVMPPREAAGLMIKLARAVHHAHQHGILHRDLKPGNFLFMEDGRACVSDFGLAKLTIQDQAPLTRTESFFGTPHYMPPEVASGTAADSTVAGDLYSMGAVFYECLTGRRPHESHDNMAALLRSISDDPVTPPESIVPELPRDLSVICMKALERTPKDRYPTLEDFAADIERWLEGRPILARPAGWVEIAWRWARRHPLPATLLGLLVVVTFSGGALLAISNARLGAALREKQRELHRSLIDQSRSKRLLGNPGHREQAMSLLKQAATLQRTREIREEGAALLARTDLCPLAEVLDHPLPTVPGDDPAASFMPSPDGSSWLVSHESGNVTWWKDGEAIDSWQPAEDRNIAASFAGNHRLIIAETSRGLLMSDPGGTRVIQPVSAEDPAVGFVSMDSQGKHVALARADGLHVVRGLDPENCWHFGSTPARCAAAWSGDGSRLAAAIGDRSEVLVLNAASGKLCSSIATSGMPEQLALDEEGLLLAVSTDDGMLSIHDAADGTRISSIPHRSSGLWFGKDDLCSLSAEGKRCTWKVERPESFRHWQEAPRAKTDGRVFGIRISPDGRRLLSVSAGCMAIWSVDRCVQTGFFLLENQRIDATAAGWWLGNSEILLQVPGGLERVKVDDHGGFGAHTRVNRIPGSTVLDVLPDGSWRVSVPDEDGNKQFELWPEGDIDKARPAAPDSPTADDTISPQSDSTLVVKGPDGRPLRLTPPGLPDIVAACATQDGRTVIAVTKNHRVISWNLSELAAALDREGL